MCYGFERWYRKARSTEELRKEHEGEEALKQSPSATPPGKPAETGKREPERDPLPV